MSYKLHREVREGRIVGLSLGLPEADAYLKFLKDSCRPNTWISYGYDLQVFLNTLQKPIPEVTSADIFAFIESQREVSRPRRLGGKRAYPDSRLSNRTIKRRLSTISGFYEYLRVCSDTPPKANPVPKGLVMRGTFWSNKFGNHGISSLIRVPQTLPRPLDSEELTRFLGSLRTHRDLSLIHI